MVELHVLRVFVGEDGRGGNPLGVVLDGRAVPRQERQSVATALGFSETVFVDDAERGAVQIFTPALELPFAGHPLVGVSWLLAHLGRGVDVLRPPAGDVMTWRDEATTWIRGRPQWAPRFKLVQLESPGEVDAHPGVAEGEIDVWAWRDEATGLVRCRVFSPVAGIAEDEATGSAATLLAAKLERPIRIQQGKGSLILATPAADGTVAIGGSTALVEVRQLK